MQHDETSLVREAQQVIEEQLAHEGRVLPAAFMLIRRNPQTLGRLTHPTAVSSVRPEPFADADDARSFVTRIREEAAKLEALAVAISGEALAEIETEEGVQAQRVAWIRIDDRDGSHHLHAHIDIEPNGDIALSNYVQSQPSEDEIGEPLVPWSPGGA